MMKTYDTYRFKNKDPIIDIIRTCIRIFATVNNVKLGKAITVVAHRSGVSPSTIYNWLNGDTISPRVCCAFAVVRATGEDVIRIGKYNVGGVNRTLRVVEGGKKSA